MFRRFLLIGVGGSGGKTLRFLRRGLEERIETTGWTEGVPTGWQFLHIDVPTAADGHDPALPPQLPDGSYVGLVTPGVNYSQLDHALLSPNATSEMLQEAAGWRPNPSDVRVEISAGAGQHRTLGRVIALANLGRIRQGVEGAMQRLNQPEAITQLDRLSRQFGNQPVNQPPNPVAIVISSIAGGSGAGIFQDVCDVLKTLGQSWADNPMGILFAPDVFDELPSISRSGVYPNALAALSELLAGYWNAEPPGDTEFSLYAPAGIHVGSVKGRGPAYPFVIGRSNAKVTYGSQLDVYAGAASSLAALLTSSSAQDDLIAFKLGNWSSNATVGVRDNLGLKSENDQTPLSSMGFASVSLGRTRFGRYASERLARMSVEHLLRAHWVGRDVPQKMKPDHARDEVVEMNFEWFRAASGLNELGETNNDILDGLVPTEQGRIINDAVNQILGEINAAGGGLRAKDWSDNLCAKFRAREPQVLATLSVATEERARSEWVPGIQHRLRDLVAQSLARVGGPVTVALLKALRKDLDNVVIELAQEEDQLRRWAAQRDSAIRDEFANLDPKSLVQPNAEFVLRASDRGRKTLMWSAEADLWRFTVAVVRDLRDNFLLPLERSVNEALTVLEREDTPPPGSHPSIIAEWPEQGILPRRYEPAVNERLIESVADYPVMFDDCIRRSVEATTPEDALREAVNDVILGLGTPGAEQQLIEMTGEWRPAQLGASSGPATKAQFRTQLAAAHVLGRARTWVHRPNTAIGHHVAESLRGYLTSETAEPVEIMAREERFRAAFTEALDLAAPLVKINASVMQRAHDQDIPRPAFSFTEIPFPQGTAGRTIVESVLRARGLDPTESRIEKTFGTGNQNSIDILSVYDAPFEPVVFESLMRPIAQDWVAQQGTVQSRRAFWKWRRSRPLTRFVPMSPGVRRDFVTGWFAARILGQIQAATDDSQPVQVYLPKERQWVSFPDPLIAPVSNELDLLPAVLESLPLALVAYAMNGEQGDAALRPYNRLTELGDNPRRALQDWILRGIVPDGAPLPRESQMGGLGDDAALRQKKVLEYLRRRQDRYGVHTGVVVDHRNFFDTRWIWELRDDLRHAFGELIRIVESTTPTDDSDND
jgi:hypothetical protein